MELRVRVFMRRANNAAEALSLMTDIVSENPDDEHKVVLDLPTHMTQQILDSQVWYCVHCILNIEAKNEICKILLVYAVTHSVILDSIILTFTSHLIL